MLCRAIRVHGVTHFLSLSPDRLLLCTTLAIAALASPNPSSAQQEPDSEPAVPTLVGTQPHELLETPSESVLIELGGDDGAELDKHDALLDEAKTQIRLGAVGLSVSTLFFVGSAGIMFGGASSQGQCQSNNEGNCSGGGMIAGGVVLALMAGRQPELEGFYGELALIDRTDSQIQKGLATAHPRLALLTPPLGSARRPGSPSASTVGTGELDEHEALLRKAKTQIRLGSTFLAVSAVLSLTGSLILVNGTIGEEDCWSSNGGNCASTGSGMAVMALGGLGIIGSAVALRRGRRSKRELERERAATSLQLSPTSASVVLRF